MGSKIKSGWNKLKAGAGNLWNKHKDKLTDAVKNAAAEELGRELTEREAEHLEARALEYMTNNEDLEVCHTQYFLLDVSCFHIHYQISFQTL